MFTNTATIDGLVRDIFEELQPPGLACAITAEGKIRYLATHGVCNSEHSTPLGADISFPIGSLTKSFAAAAILMLRDEGRLNLAQSPRNFVPELGSDWDGTSLFQLLSMQSGLGEDFGGSWAEQHLPLSNPEISQRFAVPLIRAALPGTQYFYSNFGYMVLGRVISRASGQDARAFIAQRLLDPLGMTSTSWSVPGANAACGYRRGENRFEKESLLSGCNDGAVFGGLWSSLPDMAHWVDFLASAHGSDGERYEQILSGTSRLEMQRAVALRPIAPVDEPNKPPVCLGYGFGLVNQLSRFEWTVGHGGAVPGFGCHMRWSPNTGIGLVAFANLRYADLSEGCERILAAATEKAPSRVAPIHPKVAARASALLDLVSEWNLAVAEELFAFNFFVDYPREEVAKQFKELREEFGGQLADAQIVQLGGLSAKIMISDSAIMTFTVSSFEPGHVQELIF